MPWKSDPIPAQFGITAQEYADALKDSMRTGGATKNEARRAAAKAHKAAVAGGAERK